MRETPSLSEERLKLIRAFMGEPLDPAEGTHVEVPVPAAEPRPRAPAKPAAPAAKAPLEPAVRPVEPESDIVAATASWPVRPFPRQTNAGWAVAAAALGIALGIVMAHAS